MLIHVDCSDIPYGRNIDENKMCDYTDPSKRVVFLVHGFISSANTTNSYRLASLLAEVNTYIFLMNFDYIGKFTKDYFLIYVYVCTYIY